MDWGGVLFSKAAFVLGLSVWGLLMTGNCGRTWFVTTSCRYSNSSLTPLKIDPLHPWEEKSKKIKVGEGLSAQLRVPRQISRCSDVALGASFTAHLRAERAGVGVKSIPLASSRLLGRWHLPCSHLICLLLYRLNCRI